MRLHSANIMSVDPQPRHQNSLRSDHPPIRTDTQPPNIGHLTEIAFVYMGRVKMYRLAHINAQQQPEGLAYVARTLWVGQRAPTLPESDALISGEGVAVPREHSTAQPTSAVSWPCYRPTTAEGSDTGQHLEGTLTTLSCFLDQ